jgi:hypothetical protein
MWPIYNSLDLTFFYVVGGAAALILCAIAVFVIELRRVGKTPASEWYNDRTVPLYGSTRPSLTVPRTSRRPHGTSKAA